VITSRNYDYLLGGKDNFADQAAADEFVKVMPGIQHAVREPRVPRASGGVPGC
jgi:hypothetical protein